MKMRSLIIKILNFQLYDDINQFSGHNDNFSDIAIANKLHGFFIGERFCFYIFPTHGRWDLNIAA